MFQVPNRVRFRKLNVFIVKSGPIRGFCVVSFAEEFHSGVELQALLPYLVFNVSRNTFALAILAYSKQVQAFPKSHLAEVKQALG